MIGPIFAREFNIAPRRLSLYISRTAYCLSLLILTCTAWLVLAGTQEIRGAGDFARFGSTLFQILAPLQLALVLFFAALSAAGGVAQEKDRRTILLLMLTRLSNFELVLGKLCASFLSIAVLLAAALPLYMMILMFGGVSASQVMRTFMVTLAAAIAAASLGSTIALWREKTFQTLALTTMLLVFWLFAWELVAAGLLGAAPLGISSDAWAAAWSPYRAVLEATQAFEEGIARPWWTGPRAAFVGLALAGSAALNLLAVARVRIWNPSGQVHTAGEREEWTTGQPQTQSEQTDSAAAGAAVAASPGPRARNVWNQPILWREVRTWAYGRRTIFVRLIYLVLFVLAAGALYTALHGPEQATRASLAAPMAPLFLVSLVLVNAQAVTSLTSERDGRSLDLLLVTDLTPKEIVFGKLGGVFYNTKEMLVLPFLLCGYLAYERVLSLENLVYLVGALAVLCVFVAVLGIHSGMSYPNSKNAIAVSLGTVFFLFVGVATCMRMMVAFSGSFQVQLQPFLALTFGGGVGLYFALGSRNPSAAIGIASLICPFATFYAITSFLLDYTLAVFLVTVFTYGFTAAAMLIPAVYEFDVATQATSGDAE